MKAVIRNVGTLVSGDIRGPILDAAVVIGAKGSTAIPDLIDSREVRSVSAGTAPGTLTRFTP
jgi:hypothetical protein